ncbi:MAG: hypothetical protein RIF34_10635, partial [Candidatus Kapaibacterium sp.]
MKNLLLTLLLIVIAPLSSVAEEQDTLWFRWTGEIKKVDFTPDDKYVITWTNSIEFWETQQGVVEYFIPTESTGDYNYNEEYLVFAQDSTPKLLNWQTREVIEGFNKMPTKLDRIKTAKSKNEFMAKLDQDSNTIYFWDINSKQVVDSIYFEYSFKYKTYKWKKTIHEYGYVGNNDELIYVIIDDANDIFQKPHPLDNEQHYYVHFYNRETKELVDSVYSFTNTNEQFGGFNKMQVMNDRSKIAWNHKGGEINFYDIIERKFYSKIIFDEADYVTATDIEFNKSGKFMAVTEVELCCKYIKIYNIDSYEMIYFSDTWSWENVSFSNKDELLISHVNSFLFLFPSHITTSSVNNIDDNTYNLNVTPIPSSEFIDFSFSF